MAPHTASTAKLTYRDWLRLPDDGKRHELIDGAHYVSPTPFIPHQRVVGNLYFLIRQHLERHGGGQVFGVPVSVVLSMFDVVEPDLQFVSEARRAILTHKHIHGAPDLVVEVLSESTRSRDEGVKLRLYEQSDVLEYWVVDPNAEWIRVYRRNGALLEVADELRRGRDEALETPLLPGLRLPLDRIFG